MSNPRDVIRLATVPVNATVRQGLQAIDRGAVGLCLITDEQQRLVGIATDGDIRRGLLAGLGMDEPLLKAANRQPATARVGDAAATILGLMSDRVKFVPLLDEGGVVRSLASYTSFNRIPVSAPLLGEQELRYVTECVTTGWISSAGSFVHRFEEDFAKFCGVSDAVATSNGTVALHLALVALGIGPGDEVIVPSLTFVATANAVMYTGAKPVFADVDRSTWCMDPTSVAGRITKKTKAIIPVHLYGHPAPMDEIRALAEPRGIVVIEDAAQSHGSTYHGQRTGSLGRLAGFSFYGNKIFTTGEGGMITTNDRKLAERMKYLRGHAMTKPGSYWHDEVGFNYRLTNLQAAIGVAQLERADDILAAKHRMTRIYDEAMRSIPWLEPQGRASNVESVHWLYTVLVDADVGLKRDEIMRTLAAEGIETRPVFNPLHLMPPFAGGPDLPVTDDISARGLSLPSAVTVTEDEIRMVTSRLKKFGPVKLRM